MGVGEPFKHKLRRRKVRNNEFSEGQEQKKWTKVEAGMLDLIGFGCLFMACEDVTVSTTVVETRMCRGSQEIFVCGRVTLEVGGNDEEKDIKKTTEKKEELSFKFTVIVNCLSLCPSVFHSVHQNYVGTDAEKNPFFLSVVLSDQNNQRVPQYRAILWRKSVSPTRAKRHCRVGMEP